jgi:hypothetical protein
MVDAAPEPRPTNGRTSVRLSPNKIDYLAEKILEMIERAPDVHIQTNADLVYRVVADTLFDDMRAEEDLDAEVDELLADHRREIQAKDMDYGALRAKMKREIAKKRGFIL